MWFDGIIEWIDDFIDSLSEDGILVIVIILLLASILIFGIYKAYKWMI